MLLYLSIGLGLVAMMVSLAVTPLARLLFVRLRLVDNPDNERKLHPSPVPRVGGVVIVASYSVTFALALLLPFGSVAPLRQVFSHFMAVLPAAELIFVVGLLDDVVSLRPWQKLLGQVIAAAMAFAGGVRVESLGAYALPPYWSFGLTLLWLLLCTNAFNLIDGMDGLAAGIGLFATATVLSAALIHNGVDVVLATVPLMGCLVGFLRYNFNPASVFLGDSGSLLIGFLLGCFGALWAHKSATLLGMTAPVMALTVPLLDTSLTIVRRFIRHQPIFRPDRGHIHHRLLDRGLAPRHAALLMYGVSGIAAAFSLIQSMVDNRLAGVVIVLFGLIVWLGVQHLGYVEFDVARQMLVKGIFARMIDSRTRLAALERSLARARDLDEIWRQVRKAALAFGFNTVEMHVGLRCYQDETGVAGPEWELRIPLACGGHIRFWQGIIGEGGEALGIGAFASVVNAAVTRVLAESRESSTARPVRRASPSSAAEVAVP